MTPRVNVEQSTVRGSLLRLTCRRGYPADGVHSSAATFHGITTVPETYLRLSNYAATTDLRSGDAVVLVGARSRLGGRNNLSHALGKIASTEKGSGQDYLLRFVGVSFPSRPRD